jgi:Ca2+-binding RTX toxin-like protein
MFNGNPTTDTLIGKDTNNPWTLTGFDAGTVGNTSFAGFGNLTGGVGNDILAFGAGASVSGKIDGGAGTNTLDYSAYTSSVHVNLQTLAATGTAGIRNIQNVTGSAVGGDILVGDGNNNVLTENAGNNLVIGGGAGDTLVGGSGSDILIAGRTIYDQNTAALDALLAAWGNSALTYSQRVQQLLSGVSYVDGTGAHTATLVADQTVLPSGSGASTLKGGAGLDWFFDSAADTIKENKIKLKGEIVETL